ncbi:MAG: M23 family peptidase [Eubacteriales bacterium SKADARSKE-1]|nr:M23 family peptidase [Eubacteriales bacterium SKADARSKE-1]
MNNIKLDDLNNKRQPVKKKRFYIALGICIIAIGIAAFTTYDSVRKFIEQDTTNYSTEKVKFSQPSLNEEKPQQEDQSFFNKDNTKPSYDLEKSKPHEEVESVETKAEASGVIVYPAGKDIIKKYSGENPAFSNTFNDWRIHNGIDFALPQGEKVKSITDGVVKETFDDPLLGMTIVIDHAGDFTGFYSGLGNTTMVNVGDTVEAGQEIGSINDIPSEVADGHHLHLSIKKDGKFIDPREVLGDVQ